MLSEAQIHQFRSAGHLTVANVFDDGEIKASLDDLESWSREFLESLPDDRRAWYLEQTAGGEQSVGGLPALRKLDHPVFYRPLFRSLAAKKSLVSMVEQLIGPGVSVFFSQVFMKPPEVGGPKPIHQDNHYFGPDDPDATLTAWIALDDATIENGCLFYAEGATEVAPHVAPDGEPFNLQIPTYEATHLKMLAAPVPRGGVSFHHGNTPHQSSANRSRHPRRAAAFHFIRNEASLINPALQYDHDFIVQITP